MCHNHEVPTIAPELANRTLWATFAEQEGRVFLVVIEVRRQYYPIKHFLAICCFYPTLLYLYLTELVGDMFVLECNLLNGSLLDILSWSNQVEVSWFAIAMTLGNNLFAITKHLQRTEVCTIICKLLYFTLASYGI